MVQFGRCCELVPTSVLVYAFFSRALFCSATTSSRHFCASGFTLSLLAKASLLSLVCPWMPLIHQWKTYPWASSTCVVVLGLLLSSGKLDHPVFLPRGPSILLVANTLIAAVFYVVASMAKASSRP
jgi:hypothetical protein